MTSAKFLVLFWAGLLATATMASEQHRTHVEIGVEGSGDGQETRRQSFVFDSEDAGFDLHDMGVGEVRTLTDSAGNMANVTRTEGGFQFDLDGQIIDLKELHELEGLHGEHEIHVSHEVSDVVVDDAKMVKIIKTGDADNVIVISDQELDDDHEDNDAVRRKVMIIKKEVDVTN